MVRSYWICQQRWSVPESIAWTNCSINDYGWGQEKSGGTAKLSFISLGGCYSLGVFYILAFDNVFLYWTAHRGHLVSSSYWICQQRWSIPKSHNPDEFTISIAIRWYILWETTNLTPSSIHSEIPKPKKNPGRNRAPVSFSALAARILRTDRCGSYLGQLQSGGWTGICPPWSCRLWLSVFSPPFLSLIFPSRWYIASVLRHSSIYQISYPFTYFSSHHHRLHSSSTIIIIIEERPLLLH